MAEGVTSSYDPDLGVRRETRFQYEPVAPPDTSGVGGINWSAVQENIKNHGVDETLKAVSAAIQFQGQRGYQNALKNGESAEKAITKYGPMMFYRAPQSFAPSVRALTPPAIPQMTPYQSARLGLDRERMNKPPVVPPNKFFKSGQDIVSIDPASGEVVKRINPPPPIPTMTETVLQKPNPDGGTNAPFQYLTNRTMRGLTMPSAPPSAKAAAASTPSNVTQAEYEKLKSGDLYWWNGKKIPKK